jgi:hypothetical protein
MAHIYLKTKFMLQIRSKPQNTRYLIHIPSRTDRFKIFRESILPLIENSIQITPTPIEKIVEWFEIKHAQKRGTNLSQISCFFSHLNALNDSAIINITTGDFINFRPYLIFEDDAYTDTEIFNINTIETELQTIDCDIALLGTWFTPQAKVSHLQGHWYTVHHGVIGGHTYFVKNNKAFVEIFKANKTLNFDDVLHQSITSLKVICLVPAFTYQKASPSDISPGAPVAHTELWTKRFYATTMAEWEGSEAKKEFEQKHLIPKF